MWNGCQPGLALLLAGAISLLSQSRGAAAPPAPPTNLTAWDHPNDIGNSLDLKWNRSPDDLPERDQRNVKGYKIYRADSKDGPLEEVGFVPYGVERFTDQSCTAGREYFYVVRALGLDGERSAPVSMDVPVRAVQQWFDRTRTGFAAIVIAICAAVIGFTRRARSGKNVYVRDIAALQAIDEAVGRSTEMGRPCLFIPGIQDMNEIATVAGINILSHVARVSAEYDAEIAVPTARSMVMTAARGAVQASCFVAGRPEAYNENQIYYVSDEQFAYVAHVTGYMVREKPAACFYAGIFFGESLILAETGNSIGALQIAGTSEVSQIPFFVAACDYTLIGEELFAASAYLSGEPDQLGTLKGQDFGKALAFVLLIIGCGLATVVAISPSHSVAMRMLELLRDTLLGRGGLG